LTAEPDDTVTQDANSLESIYKTQEITVQM